MEDESFFVRTETGEVKDVKDLHHTDLLNAFDYHMGFVRGITTLINHIEETDALENVGYVLNEVEDRLGDMSTIGDEMFRRLKDASKEKAA